MIALACDHGGLELMKAVKAYLESADYEYEEKHRRRVAMLNKLDG